MKLYIWEGDGISDAYHDDGTLVVLADSAEQARQIAAASNDRTAENYYERGDIWRDADEGKDAIAREPDRIVELDMAQVVAFNGGGYD